MSRTSNGKTSSAEREVRGARVGKANPKGLRQDTAGRPEPGASRQQTHRDQVAQSGNPELDGRKPNDPAPEDVLDHVKYRDRPANEGKHGDGDQEPNEGMPHKG